MKGVQNMSKNLCRSTWNQSSRQNCAIFRNCLFRLVAVIATMAISVIATPPIQAATASKQGGIEVLDSVVFDGSDGKGHFVDNLSGIAWDKDEDLLYAVSDMGYLVTYKFTVKDDKIASVTITNIAPISLESNGGKLWDLEDVVALNAANGIKGDTQLAIVFEDGPAAAIFRPDGTLVKAIDLPAPLRNPDAYRNPNKRLESITYMPDHGFAMAPQVALKGERKRLHTIYAEDGSQWSFEGANPGQSSVKALQPEPDGSLLVLESVNPNGIMNYIGLGDYELHVRRLDLSGCAGTVGCSAPDYVTDEPGRLTGRFEGLTTIGDDRYLIVTDQGSGAVFALIKLN